MDMARSLTGGSTTGLSATDAWREGADSGRPLRGRPGLWRTAVDAKNVLALHRSLRPCESKVGIGLLLLFGFRLKGPTHRFVGILPEPVSLRHFDTPCPRDAWCRDISVVAQVAPNGSPQSVQNCSLGRAADRYPH